MNKDSFVYHRFLDEAGDTTFYGKGKVPVIGNDGSSHCFILGMLKINEPLNDVRKNIIELQKTIEQDNYFTGVPSIEKKKAAYGYFLHAKDDLPEVRKMAFDLIKSIDCSFEAVVGRKIPSLYERKHNGKEAEFYADLLSHLLKNKLNAYERLVLNISHRSKCTTHTNLQNGLNKAINRANSKSPEKPNACTVVFNVQKPTEEPLLNISDYFCWAIQRIFERGENRYYDYISEQVALVQDIYDFENWKGGGNYYNRKKKLSSNNCLKIKK
ncbi:MAG: DUF3800 domain-containing protein [Chlorobaculum sp.]|jgi:hypothetical protein|nr:DUF3800 domain-containing protein [Chlorobaculum sp.]